MARRNHVVILYREGLPILLDITTLVWVCCAPCVMRTVRVLCAAFHARAVHVLSPVFLGEAFTLSKTYFLKRAKRAHQPIRPTVIIKP